MLHKTKLLMSANLVFISLALLYFFYWQTPIQFVALSVFLLSRPFFSFTFTERYQVLNLLDEAIAIVLILKAFNLFPLYCMLSALGHCAFKKDEFKGAMFILCLYIAFAAFDLLTNAQNLNLSGLALSQLVLLLGILALVFPGGSIILPLASLLSHQLSNNFSGFDLLWLMGAILVAAVLQLSERDNRRLFMLGCLALLWVDPQSVWTLMIALAFICSSVADKRKLEQITLVGALLALLPLAWLELNQSMRSMSCVVLLCLVWRYKRQMSLSHD